jgi:hypothetical protein
MRSDQLRMGLHFSEDPSEGGQQFGGVGEVPVVGSGSSRVLPESFGGVELRRVRRQLVHFQPVPISPEPRPDVAVFVVGSVVLDENGALPAIVDGQLLQEA